MSGTLAGGRKARDTNYKLHGQDFYARIGKMGGQAGHTGGFKGAPERARTAGAKGGLVSRRGWKIIRKEGSKLFYEASDGSGKTMVRDLEGGL